MYNDLIELSVKIAVDDNETAISYIHQFGPPDCQKPFMLIQDVIELVLNHPCATNEMVEAACQRLSNLAHYISWWGEPLSKITPSLWKKRDTFSSCISCLQRLYKTAFEQANQGRNDCIIKCSERLVKSFGDYARYDDAPKEFHLTMDNLSWMNWEGNLYLRERINHGPFNSARDFEVFKLLFAIMFRELPKIKLECDEYVIDIDAVQKMVQRLDELNSDFSKYHGFAKLRRDLLQKNIAKLENAIRNNNWPKEKKVVREAQIRLAIAVIKNDLISSLFT